MMTTIIIIDDHQLFREGVKRILDFEDTLKLSLKAMTEMTY